MRRAKAPHRPVLVVLTGSELGKRLVVDRSLTIGRDPESSLQLHDSLVSWHHARIEDRGDGWTLVDLGSTNGTTVNGEAKPEFDLRPNDQIVFGSTAVSFELQDAVKQEFTENLELLLNVDDLSGLWVRRKFDLEFAKRIQNAQQTRDSVALLVMDLDGIKQINDTHGHLFGAYVIGEAGRLIGRQIQACGIGCRFGGDEYLVGLPGLSTAEAEHTAQQILEAIRSHTFLRQEVVLKPGISIGVAAYPEDASDAVSLFEAADRQLYRAKQSGKNRVCRVPPGQQP